MNCSDAEDRQLRGMGDNVMYVWRQKGAGVTNMFLFLMVGNPVTAST